DDGVDRVAISPSWSDAAPRPGRWHSDSDPDPSWDEDEIELKRARRQPTMDFRDDDRGFAEGMVVTHEAYGTGKITDVSGFGALRKVRVRFNRAGERTFLASKAKLAIVQDR